MLIGWLIAPKGINTAGWGLTLTTIDMVKNRSTIFKQRKME